MTPLTTDRDRIEPDPLPVPAGRAPSPTVAATGPPSGTEFLGAKETVGGWLMPCPDCCRGWVGLAARGDGYEINLELGCTRGCHPNDIVWWHCFRTGQLPPETKPNAREIAYARKVVSNTLKEIPSRAKETELRSAAYTCARWAKPVSLPIAPIATDLMRHACRAGFDPDVIAPKLAAAFRAGAAVPARMPR